VNRYAVIAGTILGVAFAAPGAVAQVGGRPGPMIRTSSPWFNNITGYTLRPGLSPYGNPYYSFPATARPGGPPLLLKPHLVPRLLADFERPERPQPKVDYYALGRLDFFRGRYDEAARAWRRAVERDPRNGNVLMQLALADFQAGKYADAAATLRKALGALPQEKWKSVVVNRDLLYRSPDDYTARLRELEETRRRKPDDADVRLLLGYHYTSLGRRADALRELDRALELKPGDEAAKQLRAVAAKLRGNG
jgi:tetratricopeptide (TPR) repeat protein